jgi:hypothetical protein
MTNYYPFEISDSNGRYLIKAEIESPELFMKYAELFESLNSLVTDIAGLDLLLKYLKK